MRKKLHTIKLNSMKG
jgi:hypothetical protein